MKHLIFTFLFCIATLQLGCANIASPSIHQAVDKEAVENNHQITPHVKQNNKHATLHSIFGDRYKPLVTLFHVTGLSASLKEALNENNHLDVVARIYQINQVLQTEYLRPRHLERWQWDPKKFDTFGSKVDQLLEALQFKQGRLPSFTHYDYILFLGAYESTSIRRRDFLIDCWQEGIRAKHLFLLTGSRYLEEARDPSKAVLQKRGIAHPTETDMLKYLFSKEQLPVTLIQSLPDTNAFQELLQHMTIIDAKGKTGRPSTFDTVLPLVKMMPQSSSLLVVSSQPHCDYQKMVVQNVLSHCKIDVIGLKASSNTSRGEYLDAVARWIFEIKKMIDKENAISP